MVIYICDDAPEERLKLETFMKKHAKETSLSFDYASFASGDKLLIAIRSPSLFKQLSKTSVLTPRSF